MSMHIVPFIVGIDGLIGKALWNEFRPNCSGTSRNGTFGQPYLNLSDPVIQHLNLKDTTHAVIAGAIPNIQQCENEPEYTRKCNLLGTLRLAEAFARQGIQPVVFSSDYVFDGVKGGYAEDSSLNPLNQYGVQKAELEQRISNVTGGAYLLIRLSKIFPIKGGILGEIEEKVKKGQIVYAATDQIFSPISIEDVVSGISALMRAGVKGIYNLGGPEVWSRYDLAIQVARKNGGDLNLIKPISLEELNESFRRPKKTDLFSFKFEATTGYKMKKRLSRILNDSDISFV